VILQEALEALYALDDTLAPEPLAKLPLEELVQGLLTAREMASYCRGIAGQVERAVAAAMPDKKMVVPGVGVLERRVEISRKEFDVPRIAGRVVRAALDRRLDPETGELRCDEATAVLEAFMLACRPEWRVGGLKDLGIDIDQYCTKEFGLPRVQVTASK
jgi:hypothetical protein